jgi:hypothetical protein
MFNGGHFMATTAASILEEIELVLGDKSFIPLTDLIALGLFGSNSAALAAVKRGQLPIVRVSRHRFVVPRQAVLRFIGENYESSIEGR